MSTTVPTGLTPEEQAELDRLANDELYQQFLRQEGQEPGNGGETQTGQPPEPTSGEGTADTTDPLETTSGVTDDTGTPSGGGGAVAPTPSPPETSGDHPATEPTESPEPPETPEPQPPTDTPSGGVVIQGTHFTEEQAGQLLGLWQWSSALSPQQGVVIDRLVETGIIDALASGEYEIVPKGQTSPATPPPRTPSATPSPSTPPSIPDDELLSPEVREYLSSLEQRVGGLAAATEEERLRREYENANVLRQAVAQGTQEFKQKYDLDDAQTIALQQQVGAMQVLPSFAARFPGQPVAAMVAALESVYWTIPEYQQREVDRRLAAERQAQTAATTRAGKAASVTGGGGSAPRTEPPLPQNRQGMIQGMADELRLAVANGSQ